MIPEAPAIKAYRVKLPSGQTIVAGKLLQLGAIRLFYRSHPFSQAELHKWQALSFDARLLPRLKRDGAVCIDCRDADTICRIMLADFEELAVDDVHNVREGRQLYVAREHWQVISPLPYKAGWTAQEELIADGPPDRRWEPIKAPEPLSPPTPSPQQGLPL